MMPVFFTTIPIIHSVFNYGRIILTLVLLIFMFFNYRSTSISILLIFINFLIILFSTVYNESSLVNFMLDYADLFMLAFIFDIHSRIKGSNLLKVLCKLLLFITIINLITIVLFPNGLYVTGYYRDNWFLGYKNLHIRVILPMIFISYIYSEYTQKKLYKVLSSLIAISTILLINSITGFIGLSVFFIFTIIKVNKLKLSIIFLIISLVPFIILYTDILSFFDYVILSIFNRDLTLSYRTIIWQDTISLIADNLFIGIGYQNSDGFNSFINVAHPHNFTFYILAVGGFFSFVVYFLLFSNIDYKFNKFNYNHNYLYSAFFIGVFIMGITESLTNFSLLIPVIVMASNQYFPSE